MRKLILLISLCLGVILGASTMVADYRTIPLKSFNEGEVINYRVHYGFLTAGEATMVVDEQIHQLNKRGCFKIDVYGRTTGLADKLFEIDDNWGTYLDTAAIVPHKAYRYIKEGNYRKNEVVNFHQLERRAVVNKLHKESEKVKEIKELKVPRNVQDLVSGYYFLRTINFDHMYEGQVIGIDAFFDDKVYDFKVRFMGREEIKTKIGKRSAVILQPIMPENDLFSGDNPVQVWVSDDNQKIPLKIRANMVVGAIEIDIKDYQQGSR